MVVPLPGHCRAGPAADPMTRWCCSEVAAHIGRTPYSVPGRNGGTSEPPDERSGHLPATDEDLPDQRHAGPVGEVQVRRSVEHREVGPGPDAEVPDVAAPERTSPT